MYTKVYNITGPTPNGYCRTQTPVKIRLYFPPRYRPKNLREFLCEASLENAKTAKIGVWKSCSYVPPIFRTTLSVDFPTVYHFIPQMSKNTKKSQTCSCGAEKEHQGIFMYTKVYILFRGSFYHLCTTLQLSRGRIRLSHRVGRASLFLSIHPFLLC